METKSNSMDVALRVLLMPKAASKSGSVPQAFDPSSKVVFIG